MAVKKSTKKDIVSVARSSDGTIQLTFTIPATQIAKEKEKAVGELAKNIEITGFRKGKAPIDKARAQIPENTLIEKTLSGILPVLFSKAIKDHKLKPIIYPKFEVVKATEGEAWQIRGTTCELPEITLGDYKKQVTGDARSKDIWTPDKGSPKEKKEITREQKEQGVIKTLIDKIKIKIPRILVEEEVNARLSGLLARLEKLGITLENYLASNKKTTEALRTEYQKQAKELIALDLILNKIATTENIKAKENDVKEALKANAAANPDQAAKANEAQQKRQIETILTKRAVIDMLVALI